MELTRSVVEENASEYEAVQPLAAREQDHLETFPEAFESGDYGWKDAEWVVRWYFRRYLGAYPDDQRREIEDAFADNDFEDVRDAIAAARDADDVEAKVRRLTTLSGVDVAVASAFLLFLDPTAYVVVDDRAWDALRAAGELDEPYPESLSPAAYRRYLSTCRSLADRFDCSLLELYRALWRLGSEHA
jgi:hypothetical protein